MKLFLIKLYIHKCRSLGKFDIIQKKKTNFVIGVWVTFISLFLVHKPRRVTLYMQVWTFINILVYLSRLRFFPLLSQTVVLFTSRSALQGSLSTNRRPSYWFHKRNLDRCFLTLPWNQLFQLSPVGAGIFRARFELIPLARRFSIPRAVICIQMRGSSSRDYARRRGLLILKLLSGLERLYYFSRRSRFCIYRASRYS